MPSKFLKAAIEAAEAAAYVIREGYQSNVDVRYKEDASPVTEVDEMAEASIKEVLRDYFPDHGFYGEESGKDNADADYLWLVDPIDGTKSFVRGYPVFSTQIALMHKGDLILGVSSAPCWHGGVTMWAEQGEGAWITDSDSPMSGVEVSTVDTLDRATLSTGNLNSLAQSDSWERFGKLIPKLHRLRGYGDFIHYHWLAQGKIDAVMESDLNILDIAALTVIVREAGGIVTDLTGGDIGLETSNILAATPTLHAQIMEEIKYSA